MSTRRPPDKSRQAYLAKLRKVAAEHPLPTSEYIGDIDIMSPEAVHLQGNFSAEELMAILRHMEALGKP